MSPLSLPVLASVCNVTLVVDRLADSVSAPMPLVVCVPLPDEMVKSVGSTSQVPVLPVSDRVLTRVPAATLTWAADVSMKPPSPPAGALASSVPATFTVPVSMSPISRMRPALFWIVFASMIPVLLTVAVVRLSMALADSSTWPPLAWISCLFSASALMAPWSML
ncbi:hypothetical protein D9M73_92480 [compost metagenome]